MHDELNLHDWSARSEASARDGLGELAPGVTAVSEDAHEIDMEPADQHGSDPFPHVIGTHGDHLGLC